MKAKSNTAFILRLAVTLLLICTVVAAVLAAVNSYTAPIIAKQKEEKTQLAIEAVLPGGGEEMTDLPGVDFEGANLVSKVYKGDAGYAIEVTPVGFDNTITMMVGTDNAGNVLGIDIIKHTSQDRRLTYLEQRLREISCQFTKTGSIARRNNYIFHTNLAPSSVLQK